MSRHATPERLSSPLALAHLVYLLGLRTAEPGCRRALKAGWPDGTSGATTNDDVIKHRRLPFRSLVAVLAHLRAGAPALAGSCLTVHHFAPRLSFFERYQPSLSLSRWLPIMFCDAPG
jgi:hypothetical protein